MMYLSYEEYKNLGGTLSETDFRMAEFKARKRIDYLTAERVKAMADAGQVPEAVQLCVMSLVNLESKVGTTAQADNPVVTSYTTDGYTEHYGNAMSAAEANTEMDKLVQQLLFGEVDLCGVPLLYRGVRG